MKIFRNATVLLAIIAAQSAIAATFTVTSALPGGSGSLNDAILQANDTIGTNTIAFNIPGPGVHTIALTNALPEITRPVIMNGYTQPGASPNTLAIGDNAVILIKIDGSSVSPILRLCNSSLCGGPGSSDGSTIRGLCFVTTAGGTMLDIRSHTNLLAGNFIGVDTDGVTLVAASTAVFVGFGTSGNTIGGVSPSDRNVIAGNSGVLLIDGSSTVVQGNYLGVNAAGTAPLGSGDFAIDVEIGTGCIIGGSAPGAGNLINARVRGVQLASACLSCPVSGTVQGNLIGTDATGTIPLHRPPTGLLLGTSDNSLIGGNTPAAANVISAGGDGIAIQGSPVGLVIQGNRIGIDITGTLPLGNGSCGIDVLASTTSGTIGGTNAGEGNIIAYNGGNGISIQNGNSGWSILGNSIHDNGRLGISLFGCGVNTPTPNDTCDTDTGGNGRQNYPIITGVSLTGGIVTLSGTLNSGTNASYRLEFFGNPSCDPTGFGQGTVFIGATNVTTTNCDTTFTAVFPNAGEYSTFTATATDPNGSTSEFSPCAFAAPRLTIERVPPSAVRLLWPTNPSGFNLEFNTNLNTAIWQSASPTPVILGTNNVVTNATTIPQQFYRVKK